MCTPSRRRSARSKTSFTSPSIVPAIRARAFIIHRAKDGLLRSVEHVADQPV